MGNNYQRLFFIFKNMDSDFGSPTGFVKIEINHETTKLNLSLNNMMDRKGVTYQLYGISKNDSQLLYTLICDIPIINGRADIKVNRESKKLGSMELNVEDINIYAIVTVLKDRGPMVICPLVAYTRSEVDWKREFDDLVLNRNQPISIDSNMRDELIEESVEVAPYIEEQVEEQPIVSEVNEEPEVTQEREVIEEIECDAFEYSERDAVEIQIQEQEQEQPETVTSKFEGTLTSIYNNTIDPDEYSEIRMEDDIWKQAEKDFQDISSFSITDEERATELNLPNLKEELDKSFEKCNPFKSRSRNFKWWKINSPGFLNNILFRNGIKTYLLFSPKVMLAHYKYRYIIFGIKSDRPTAKPQLICGIPGVYSIDENPFGNMGSWVQLEGYKPKYGTFGYWVVMIDPRTGKLINIK